MYLPVGVLGIFVVTFTLIFLFINTTEQYLTCLKEPLESNIPDCKIVHGRSGDFIITAMAIGLLMLVDVGLVYQVLVDYLI